MALRALQGPAGGSAPVGGSGTPGTIPVWSTGTTLGNSGLLDNGTSIYTTARRFGVGVIPDAAYSSQVASGHAVWDGNAANGRVVTWASGSAATGYIEWRIGGGARLGYIGASSTDMLLQLENSADFAVMGGNVGIGTASPGTRLHVNAGNGIRVTDATGTAGFDMVNFAGDAYLYNRNTGVLVFGSSNTERMRINSAGAAADSQVAIGTTSFTSGRALTTVQDIDVYGVRVGRGAGAVSTNTALGSGALNVATSGQSNTAVGVSAAAAIATSSFQTAVGARAAQLNTSASSTMVGADCASAATSASEITAVGSFCLGATVTASRASAVGCLALYSITGSNDTCALGHSAGRYAGAGTTANTSATDSIFIGSDSRAGASGNSNEIVIGKGAIGNGSNTVTIGNSSNVGTFLDTKYVRLVDSYTVGTLPAAGTAGRIARVTDGDAALAWGATVVNTGAGATPYLVWDNGTNWTVFGK